MAAMAGILNHQLTARQALAGMGATPMDSSTSGTSGTNGTGSSSSTSSSGGDSATISANDFLTLLVTEMQNQDPTADADPNEYINQLVSVNSLEQLIDINQTLSTSLGTPAPSNGSTSGQVAAATPGPATLSLTGANPSAAGSLTHASAQKASALTAQSIAPSAATAGAMTALAATIKRAPGNLSVPTANPAAHRVGHALDGQPAGRSAKRTRPQSIPGGKL